MNLPPFLREDTYGEIILAGHRIPLYTVIRLLKEGYDTAGTADYLPTLSLGEIEQVLGFYHDHQEQVDAYCEEVRAEIERQAAIPSRGPSAEELRRRCVAKGMGPLP